MKNLLERFIKLEREVSKEMGAFNLFALFLREDEQDLWDIVVAAPWLAADKKSAYQYLTGKLQKEFTTDEFLQLSHIAIIENSNPGLREINQQANLEHGLLEFRDIDFFGRPIKHADIITSQPVMAQELRPAA